MFEIIVPVYITSLFLTMSIEMFKVFITITIEIRKSELIGGKCVWSDFESSYYAKISFTNHSKYSYNSQHCYVHPTDRLGSWRTLSSCTCLSLYSSPSVSDWCSWCIDRENVWVYLLTLCKVTEYTVL